MGGEDIGAFEAFIVDYQKRAFSIAYRILGNVDDAQDAVQEAFLRAFRSWKGFRGDSAVTTWFHSVVVNTSIDVGRKRKSVVRPYESVPDKPDTTIRGPEKAAQGVEIRETVRDALKKLPERQRDVFFLRHFEGLDVKEIGKSLGLAEGTVKVHLSRAVHALKKGLSHYDL